MRPVFEQTARLLRCCFLQHLHRVESESREERHIMRAHNRADGVYLQEAETGQLALQMAPVDDRTESRRSMEAVSAYFGSASRITW